MKVVLASVCLLFAAGTADAHVEMTSPAPRTTANKAPPCGGAARGNNGIHHFAPGETIVMEWDETVDHPGHYRIAIDMDGDDSFKNPSTPDDAFPETLVEPIADKVGGHYTQEVTLPETPCDNCTLQLIQVMTTRVPYNSFYYQCADITIGEGGGDGSGSGSDGGGDGGGGGGDPEEVGGCATSSGAGLGAVALVLGEVLRKRRR